MSTYQDLVQDILGEINLLRENPSGYAERLENEFDNYKINNVRHRPGTIPLQTREGLAALKEVYEELKEMEPLKGLDLAVGLVHAAYDLCQDAGSLGIVGHIGSKETSLQRRVENYGKWTENIVEALDYDSANGYEVVLSLLIDDGLATRPHRKALLSPNFSKIGVAASPHSEFKTMCCLLFAVDYVTNDGLELPDMSNELVPQHPEIENWLEGAVKLTCEIRDETVNGVKVKKIKKHWQMADGQVKVVEEIEGLDKHSKNTSKDTFHAKSESRESEKHSKTESKGSFVEKKGKEEGKRDVHVDVEIRENEAVVMIDASGFGESPKMEAGSRKSSSSSENKHKKDKSSSSSESKHKKQKSSSDSEDKKVQEVSGSDSKHRKESSDSSENQ